MHLFAILDIHFDLAQNKVVWNSKNIIPHKTFAVKSITP